MKKSKWANDPNIRRTIPVQYIGVVCDESRFIDLVPKKSGGGISSLIEVGEKYYRHYIRISPVYNFNESDPKIKFAEIRFDPQLDITMSKAQKKYLLQHLNYFGKKFTL